MLPDFPKIKREFGAYLRQLGATRMRHHMGPMAAASHSAYYEGTGTRITREAGDTETSPFVRSYATTTLSVEELEALTPGAVFAHVDDQANQIATQVVRHAYRTIALATERVGNALSLRDEPFSIRAVHKALRRIQLDFDSDGRPIMPSIHIHPHMQDVVQTALREAEGDEALVREFDDLIATKREEWRVREASRELVG